MAMTTGKVLLWVAGGVLALGCGGVILLYGAASLAMWKSSQSIERDQAQREAAFKAMTPEQHLAQAQAALEQEHNASYCLALLKHVPEGTPGRAELFEAATSQQEAEDKAEAAFRALTPERHLADAKAAMDAGDLQAARRHIFYVPRTTPGCEAFLAALREKEKARDAGESR
jgi:hypothetical protein